MLLEAIRSELVRLQIHPVNLDVAAEYDRSITLRGSLLRYWPVPETTDGPALLGLLQGLPDAAGSAVTMAAFSAAQAGVTPAAELGECPRIRSSAAPLLFFYRRDSPSSSNSAALFQKSIDTQHAKADRFGMESVVVLRCLGEHCAHLVWPLASTCHLLTRSESARRPLRPRAAPPCWCRPRRRRHWSFENGPR